MTGSYNEVPENIYEVDFKFIQNSRRKVFFDLITNGTTSQFAHIDPYT